MNGRAIVVALAALALATPALGHAPSGEPGRGGGGPNPLKNVDFGEQHLHTVNSPVIG